MSKTTTHKTLKNTRIYIQYFDDLDNKITLITLSFRSEKSLNAHLKKYKISKKDIVYKSSVPPFNKDLYPSASKIKSAISAFETCYGSQEEFAIV